MRVTKSGIGNELVLQKDRDVERCTKGTELLYSGGSIGCYAEEVM